MFIDKSNNPGIYKWLPGTFLNITEKISRKIKPVKYMKKLSYKSVVR